MFYGCYADDSSLIYNGTCRQIDIVHNYLNSVNKFTLEVEDDGKLNFLHLTVNKNENKIQFRIYWKHAATDIILHPIVLWLKRWSQYMIGCLLRVSLSLEDYNNELGKHVAPSNGFNEALIDNILRERKKHKVTNVYGAPSGGTRTYNWLPIRTITSVLNNNSNLTYKISVHKLYESASRFK